MNQQFDPSDEIDRLIGNITSYIRYWPLAAAAVIVFCLLLLLPTMVYQIDRDERGLILRFGRLSREVSPGLGWKLPYPAERLYKVNTERINRLSFGSPDESRVVDRSNYQREALILTGDLGVAKINWDVLYRRTDPARFLFNIRDEEKLIRQAAQAALRIVAGDYDVVSTITDKRREIALKTRQEMQRLMDNYNSGITITEIYLQQTEPPDPVAPAFRRVNSSRQIREELRFEAERERERVLNEASGSVDRMVSEAHGDSAAIINRARGEAERFLALLAEYQLAPDVTRQRLFLETIEKIMEESDEVYLIDKNLKGLLPLLDLGRNH